MTDKDKEEAQLNANNLILLHGDTKAVKSFLLGCALNLKMMEDRGEPSSMELEIHGTSLTLTLN